MRYCGTKCRQGFRWNRLASYRLICARSLHSAAPGICGLLWNGFAVPVVGTLGVLALASQTRFLIACAVDALSAFLYDWSFSLLGGYLLALRRRPSLQLTGQR